MLKSLCTFIVLLAIFLQHCHSQDSRCNGVPSTNWSCCDHDSPCGVGGGDCDRDSDCLGDFKCGNNNCQNDFANEGGSWSPNADCCYDPGNNCKGIPSTDWNCCSEAFPCRLGGGDCDEDSQCEGNLVCGSDNCQREFSSNGTNWMQGADCCREKSQYTKSSDEGACCVSAEEQHEGCYIHSSFTLVSDEVCRSACDNDFQCKGYTIQDVNGGMFCRLATAPSQCPHNWNILAGGNGPLDPSSLCETDYEGCYLKQDVNIPAPTSTSASTTTTTSTSTSTTTSTSTSTTTTTSTTSTSTTSTTSTASSTSDSEVSECDQILANIGPYWPNVKRALEWCTNAAGEGGNCCNDSQMDLDLVRRLPDPRGFATNRPICWYSTTVQVGTVDESLKNVCTTEGSSTTAPTTVPGSTGNVTIDCESPYDQWINLPDTVIMSPNHPQNYENRKDCQVTIRFAEGQRVAIQFEAFDIESHSSCSWDYLKVRDGDNANSNLIGSKLCGSSNPGVIESTGNSMTLQFHTDGSVTKTGFKIRTSVATGIPPTTNVPSTTSTTAPTTSTTTNNGNPGETAIDCSSPFDEVTTPGTTVISPNHPGNYESNKVCQITIRFSERVRIRFEAFNIESHSSCNYDYLEVRDGESSSSNLIGSKLCGTTIPEAMESSGSSMTLIFRSDSSVVRSGFKLIAELATGELTTTTMPTTQLPSGGCGVKPARVVGGSEASPYSLPWQVALVRPGSNSPFCGGTLISPRHVLTAAHCTGANGGNWDVIVGEHRITDTSDGTRHTKCRHVDHPDYNNPVRLTNDFSIVHLNQPVQIGTRAAPACLPTSNLAGSFLDDKTMTTSGWGTLCSGCSQPDVLNVVNVPGVSNTLCNQRYGGGITDEMICAGEIVNGGVDACQGDSGGPLTYNDGGRATLVGVVSWGRGCALATHPGVYARVTEVIPWINEQLTLTC